MTPYAKSCSSLAAKLGGSEVFRQRVDHLEDNARAQMTGSASSLKVRNPWSWYAVASSQDLVGRQDHAGGFERGKPRAVAIPGAQTERLERSLSPSRNAPLARRDAGRVPHLSLSRLEFRNGWPLPSHSGPPETVAVAGCACTHLSDRRGKRICLGVPRRALVVTTAGACRYVPAANDSPSNRHRRRHRGSSGLPAGYRPFGNKSFRSSAR